MSMSQRICTHCVLPDSFPGISFDKEGVCSVCRRYEQQWGGWKSRLPERGRVLEKICKDARSKHKEFDALVPLSGGKDSTYVLYVAVKKLGLHCLAYTMNHGYLSEHARDNVDRACRKLGVEHIYYRLDLNLTNRLFALFMRKTGSFCSVCTRAIGMATSRVADMYRVPLIMTGTSLRTELPLSPETDMAIAADSIHYIRNVLHGEPIAAECKRLVYGGSIRRKIGTLFFVLSGRKSLKFYAWLNLPDYIDWDYDSMRRTVREELGWQEPPKGPEHMDCVIAPVAKYLHNRRFPGLEQRRLTLAGLVMARQISREEALRRLDEESEEQCPESVLHMFLRNLEMSKKEFDRYIDMGPRHLQFRPRPNPVNKAATKLLSIRDKAGIK